MPHLADLHLYGVLNLHLINPSITGNLTSLFIGSRHDNPLRRNIKDVLNVLSRKPLLERFTVTHCNFHTDVVGAIIHVSALRYLGLEAETLIDVACIFNSLVLSPGARVHLAAEIPYGGSDLEVWDILGRALSQSTWVDLHTLELLSLPEVEPEIIRRVSPEDEDSFAISAWRDDEPGYACFTGQPAGERRIQLRLGITQELRPEPDFCLRLRGYFGGSSRDHVLPRVIALFGVASDLRTLSLRPDRMVDSKLSWLDIFMQYPLLTGIRVDNEKDLDRLFAALYFNDQPLPVRELETISFPRSRRLASYWSASVDWKHPSNKNKKKRGERGRLLAGLMQQRESAGAPFANIYLRRSQLQGEELWDSLTRGSGGHSDFMHQARQIVKPMELWNWEDWGTGL